MNEEDCEFIDDDVLLDERGNNLKDIRLGDCNDRINPTVNVKLDRRPPNLPDNEGEEVKK